VIFLIQLERKQERASRRSYVKYIGGAVAAAGYGIYEIAKPTPTGQQGGISFPVRLSVRTRQRYGAMNFQ